MEKEKGENKQRMEKEKGRVVGCGGKRRTLYSTYLHRRRCRRHVLMQ
jgi:rRNA processing protein Krr1/Pno1